MPTRTPPRRAPTAKELLDLLVKRPNSRVPILGEPQGWGSDNTMQTALVIILLLAILGGAVFVGHYGWVSAGDVTMPAWGWMMMGLGIFFTLLVGGGLMALVFYSSRAGFDEPPEVVQKKKRRVAKWAKMIPRRKKRRSS
jgi:hypothetical protein